jgi:hypothetical protein
MCCTIDMINTHHGVLHINQGTDCSLVLTSHRVLYRWCAVKFINSHGGVTWQKGKIQMSTVKEMQKKRNVPMRSNLQFILW